MKVPYAKKWQKETNKLRQIALDCGLTEERKWGKPCFTFQKKKRGDRDPAQRGVRILVLQRRTAQRPRVHSPKDRTGTGGPLDQIHRPQRNLGTVDNPEELHQG